MDLKVGRSFRHSEKDQEVLDAWKEYIDSLGENVSRSDWMMPNRRWEPYEMNRLF